MCLKIVYTFEVYFLGVLARCSIKAEQTHSNLLHRHKSAKVILTYSTNKKYHIYVFRKHTDVSTSNYHPPRKDLYPTQPYYNIANMRIYHGVLLRGNKISACYDRQIRITIGKVSQNSG